MDVNQGFTAHNHTLRHGSKIVTEKQHALDDEFLRFVLVDIHRSSAGKTKNEGY